jgi:LIVCS family branched-chain amino acid:cation transporter
LKPFWEASNVTIPAWMFALFFILFAYAATFRQAALLGIIGKFLSPLKVASITSIIMIGLWYAQGFPIVGLPVLDALKMGMTYGYGTLDLIGAIFFGAIIVALLRQDKSEPIQERAMRQLIVTATYASVGAAILLGLIYGGMVILGAAYGQGLESLNEGALFSAITFMILGPYGAALIAGTVFLACFTTIISLAVVVADYVRTDLTHGILNYQIALAVVLALCMIPASFDLSVIMNISLPIIVASYPLFIVVTACNALHKLVGLNMIKGPFILTLGYLICSYSSGIIEKLIAFFV